MSGPIAKYVFSSDSSLLSLSFFCDCYEVAAGVSLSSRAGAPPLHLYQEGLVPYEGTVIYVSLLLEKDFRDWLKALWIKELLCFRRPFGKTVII